jgi:hypothetical protein
MGRAEELFATIVAGGETAIDEFIYARASEELFLDFKRSANCGQGSRLHQNDRANLEKAVSGFGNSEGGVIVWGVDCSRDPATGDVASAKLPIEQPTRFKSWLENATSGVTVPVHGGVRHHAVPTADQTGFVVTLIPISHHAPHQTTNDKRYYMRAGSSFLPVPHAVLAGMFGRRPNPNVYPLCTILSSSAGVDQTGFNYVQIEYAVSLCNDGPGIAEDLFINLDLASAPGEKCSIDFKRFDRTEWFVNYFPGRKVSLISRGGLKLAPNAHILPTPINMIFHPPFNEPLRITGNCGCSGSPTFPILIEADPTVIRNAFEHTRDLLNSRYADNAAKSFEKRVFPNLGDATADADQVTNSR